MAISGAPRVGCQPSPQAFPQGLRRACDGIGAREQVSERGGKTTLTRWIPRDGIDMKAYGL